MNCLFLFPICLVLLLFHDAEFISWCGVIFICRHLLKFYWLKQYFNRSWIFSFTHSFIHSIRFYRVGSLFISWFIYLFIYSFIYIFNYLFNYLFILFTYSIIYLFIYSFILFFIQLFIHLFICSYYYSLSLYDFSL